MNFYTTFTCIALFTALTQLGCGTKPSPDPLPVVVDVKTSAVRSGSIEETVDVTGSTSAQREAQLRSPITGVIVRFTLLNGDPVKRRETIAVIRTKESQASIQGAQELVRIALTPQQQEEAQQALALARKGSRDVAITAPFDGVLTMKQKNEKEVVAEGEQLASLVDMKSIVFVADVPVFRLGKIKIGQSVHVQFSTTPVLTVSGTVRRVESQANPSDQTVRVQIQLISEIPNLTSSLFGYAGIVVGKKSNALLVPATALLHNDETNVSSVMVVTDSLARNIPVKLGIVRDSVAEVSSPALSVETKVITEGQYGLPDSTRVRVIQ